MNVFSFAANLSSEEVYRNPFKEERETCVIVNGARIQNTINANQELNL